MSQKTNRILDLDPAALTRLSGRGLLAAIRAAEGRTVLAETVVTVPPLVDGCSNPELAAAFGADLILLNLYDVNRPAVAGFPARKGTGPDPKLLKEFGLSGVEEVMGWGMTAGEIRRIAGRPVGINLEPIPEGELPKGFAPGRRATAENARKAVEQGVDFLVLTGNPGTGVTWSAVAAQVRCIREELGRDLPVMAGKMHGAGTWENQDVWLEESVLEELAKAGLDVLLLPQSGTVPGVTPDHVKQWVDRAHRFGMMVMLTVGTSQEGAAPTVLERLALDGKAAGGDVLHIGDAGFAGMAPPENIMAYSIALRGKRHTYRRMGQSLTRPSRFK